MVLAILSLIVLGAAFFSAENLVTVIVGGLVSMGLTQWLKDKTDAYGPLALIVAVVVSLLVALVAIIGSSILGGTSIEWNALPQYGAQLFALATVVYKLFLADDSLVAGDHS